MNTIGFSFDEKLDTDFLKSIFNGDLDHAAIVFDGFLQTIHADIHETDTALLENDIALFRKKIHRTGPSFSYVGLTFLTAEAAVLEDYCEKDPDLQVLSTKYNRLKKILDEMIPVIKKDLNTLNAYKNIL